MAGRHWATLALGSRPAVIAVMNSRSISSMPFVETAAEIGHDYVTIAWMRPENRKTIDDFKRWAEEGAEWAVIVERQRQGADRA